MKISIEVQVGSMILLIGVLAGIFFNLFIGLFFIMIGLLYFTGFFREEMRQDKSSSKKKKSKKRKGSPVLTYSDGIVTRYESRPKVKIKNPYSGKKKGKYSPKYMKVQKTKGKKPF
ncbi:MAG: hypothetical protein ACXAC7_04910 [Candidatus Hodarchaeales archaeon]